MVRFPSGSLSVLSSSISGYICKCLGYHTPLVKYYDMGKGYEEPVYQSVNCYGWIYNCSEFEQLPVVTDER